jgi:aminopeptidase 2
MFAPVAARSAFPCWDEPVHKATYDLVMVAREGETVLSNMPVVSTETWAAVAGGVEPLQAGYRLGTTFTPGDGNWVSTTFYRTPPMSTYLLCFACGEFAHIEGEYTSRLTGKTVPLRMYATPNQVSRARFSLDVTRACVPVYEELFGIPYPLPKLDTLVAHDFDMGAMENWGLITGRTTAFLLDERSSLAAKKRVGTLQMHEVAHMW